MKYTFKFGLSKYITNFDADDEWGEHQIWLKIRGWNEAGRRFI
jgi:hypothetical protein